MTRTEFARYYEQHAERAIGRLVGAGKWLGDGFPREVARDAVQAATLSMLNHLDGLPSTTSGGYLYRAAFREALRETGCVKAKGRHSRQREISFGGLADLDMVGSSRGHDLEATA